MIKIKDFSENTGFSIRMLRYLEELKLLLPDRADNNYRQYHSHQIEKAKKIKSLQELGFQLNEIKNLLDLSWNMQIPIIEEVLNREKEISEIKSETIPQLRSLIDRISEKRIDILSILEKSPEAERKLKTPTGEPKFQRTAYNIPILRTIYEEHLEDRANINCLETDIMKFGQWLQECHNIPKVYSILNESAFSFGINLTDSFIENYKSAWSKFLPRGEMGLLADFSIDDLKQLMGHHDLIIRTKFEYRENKELGEIVIPYTPIYTMTRL